MFGEKGETKPGVHAAEQADAKVQANPTVSRRGMFGEMIYAGKRAFPL